MPKRNDYIKKTVNLPKDNTFTELLRFIVQTLDHNDESYCWVVRKYSWSFTHENEAYMTTNVERCLHILATIGKNKEHRGAILKLFDFYRKADCIVRNVFSNEYKQSNFGKTHG